MHPLCETIVLDYLPVIRGMIAKTMMEKYGFSQKVTAQKLGISQPAVSQYKQQIRGAKHQLLLGNPQALGIIESLTGKLAAGELTADEANREFCELCRYIRPDGAECTIPVSLRA